MKTSASKDLVYEIVDEIGADVSYFRLKEPAKDERLYLTGIEIGAFFGTMILGSFCIGFIKGFSQGLGTEMGKQAAMQTIKRLEGIIHKMQRVDPTDVKSVNEEVLSSQAQLDEVIVNDIPKIVPPGEMSKSLEATHEHQVREVDSCLRDYGFPPEKASSHSERIAGAIREEWPLS